MAPKSESGRTEQTPNNWKSKKTRRRWTCLYYICISRWDYVCMLWLWLILYLWSEGWFSEFVNELRKELWRFFQFTFHVFVNSGESCRCFLFSLTLSWWSRRLMLSDVCLAGVAGQLTTNYLFEKLIYYVVLHSSVIDDVKSAERLWSFEEYLCVIGGMTNGWQASRPGSDDGCSTARGQTATRFSSTQHAKQH